MLAATPDDGVGLAACLRTVVLMGNTDRALDLLLPRVDRVEALTDPTERRWLAASAAWTLGHGLRLGMVPSRVAHDDVDAARARLDDLARGLCADDEDRAASSRPTTTGPSPRPGLPPTRLPLPPTGEAGLRAAASGDEVVALAERARAWRRTLDPALERLLHGWLETRERTLPLLTEPAHRAAAALLDRSSVHLLRDPVRERLRLDEALAAAARGLDDEGVAHARCELLVLDAREAAASFGDGGPRGGARAPARARRRRRARGPRMDRDRRREPPLVRAVGSSGRRRRPPAARRGHVRAPRPAGPPGPLPARRRSPRPRP